MFPKLISDTLSFSQKKAPAKLGGFCDQFILSIHPLIRYGPHQKHNGLTLLIHALAIDAARHCNLCIRRYP